MLQKIGIDTVRDAAGIGQSRDRIDDGAPFLCAEELTHLFCVDHGAQDSDDSAIAEDRHLACEDLPVLAVHDAVPSAQADLLPGLQDLFFVLPEGFRVDVPHHVLIRLPDDLLLGLHAIELQKALARADKPPVGILPEIQTVRIHDEILPEHGIGYPAARLAGSDVGERSGNPFEVLFLESRLDHDMHGLVEVRPLHRDDDVEKPVVLSRRRDTPKDAHERMALLLLEAGLHGGDVDELRKPALIGEVAVIRRPGMDHRGEVIAQRASLHGLIRQGGFHALNRALCKVVDGDVAAHVVEIAHGPHRHLLEIPDVEFHVLDVDGIEIVVPLFCRHGS